MNKKISSSLKQLVKVNTLSENEDTFEIVMFVSDMDLAQKQIKILDASLKIETFKFIGAIGLCVTTKFLNVLASYKNVLHITCSSKVLVASYKALDITNINKLHAMGLSGKGVTVAIIDTGTYPHLDLCFPRKKVIKFVNLIDERKNLLDDNGHGTFVAGLLAGRGIVSNRVFKGVAFNSNFISIKAMNEKGETSAFYILKAMEWIFDNAKKYDIKVVCMSFGSEPLDEKDPLVMGAESLWDKGIVVVAAAGNSGPGGATIKSPAVSSKILTVGAIDDGREKIVNGETLNEVKAKNSSNVTQIMASVFPRKLLPKTSDIFEYEQFVNERLGANDKYLEQMKLSKCKIANFSSRGPAKNLIKPDVVAPGVKIVGLSNDKKNPYTIMSGTSMATPIVAGLVCLMLEYNSNLTPRQIKEIIINSGRKLSFNRNEEGAGLIDAIRCIVN